MSARIVIVAQHADFQHLLTQFMHHLGRGYEVIGVASEVAEALACIATLEPDLALVDAELSHGCGLEVAVALRRRPATLVIVLGSHEDTEYRRAALAAGAADYISKFDLVATLPTALRATLPAGS